jgi:hypothetical protein
VPNNLEGEERGADALSRGSRTDLRESRSDSSCSAPTAFTLATKLLEGRWPARLQIAYMICSENELTLSTLMRIEIKACTAPET